VATASQLAMHRASCTLGSPAAQTMHESHHNVFLSHWCDGVSAVVLGRTWAEHTESKTIASEHAPVQVTRDQTAPDTSCMLGGSSGITPDMKTSPAAATPWL
jgi:hypothetical protein